MRKTPFVAWTKHRLVMTNADCQWNGANQRPTKILFVINFDLSVTRTHDIDRHHDPCEKVLNV